MKLLLAALLLFVSSSALANETSILNLSGSWTQTIEGRGCPTYICVQSTPWTGQLTVVTDSLADGVYYPGALQSVTLISNHFGGAFVYHTWTVYSDISVTIAGGHVDSIDGGYQAFAGAIDRFNLAGMSVSYSQSDLTCRVNCVYTHGGGTLIASHMPEPATYAMMLIGLGIVGVARRRSIRVG